MKWSTEKELKDQILRLWESGDLLRSTFQTLEKTQIEKDLTEKTIVFPYRLTLKMPNSNELSDQFEEARLWIEKIISIKKLKINWREFNHRILGRQKIPQSIFVESLQEAISFISKKCEEQYFIEIAKATINTHTELLPWLKKRPLQALALHQEWGQILAIVSWIKKHPQPKIYLRQMDIVGVHSKFIETHRRVLIELLDLALHDNAINRDYINANQFAARYGFLEKPQRIRFRSLDSNLSPINHLKLADISLDSASFSLLNIKPKQVFITENEINFLAFPLVKEAIVIFGAGYGWGALAKASWLQQCEIYYWGDIDTHGFAILNQLRSYFPHVQSLLMDQNTLMSHQHLWGVEEKPVKHELHLLTENEAQLFQALQGNHWQKNLRLEQEHIGFHHLYVAIENIQIH